MSTVENYGRFLEDEGCFELTSEPPRKWLNLHCNAIGDDEMWAEVSNIGDGQTWVRDKNGVKVVLSGYDCKYVYVRDEDSGTVWCPAGNPAPTEVQDRVVRYYPHQTLIQSTCEGIKTTQRVFVPQEYPIEIQTITLENTTDKPRKVSVFSYCQFELTGCDAEGSGVGKDNFSEVLPEVGGVIITNRNAFAPTNRFKGYLMALENFKNGNGYRDHFTRAEFSLGTPRIMWGWDCDGRPGYGPDCAGVVQAELEIEPGGTARADFIIGQCSGLQEVKDLRAELSPKLIDRMCEHCAEVEAERQAAFQVETGFENYDALMNIFVKKQLYCYLINKSGFRDNLQVDAAIAMTEFDVAKNNLLRALASQFPNGSVPHGFRPLNRLQYSDKPAWILMTVPMMLQESGDFSLLDEEVPFFESEETGTVWEHMLRAMRFLAGDLGKNGLCDQHHADWNDGLEATQEAGERESVFVTEQLCYGLLQVQEIARRIDDEEVEKEASELYDTFKERLNEVAWDGEWYVRTICGDGYRIGSKENQDGQIFLNTQSWSVISGIAPEERAESAMENVDEQLEVDIGYRICYPPFSEYDPRVGRMSNSMVGSNENGGCYNHAAGFKGVADCLLGRAEEAWRTYRKVTPDNPENPVSNSGAEPFSYVNSYSMVPYVYGKSGYAWRTGTAGWMTMLLVEYILGARRGWDGLVIDPCLTPEIEHARVVRKFRGATYEIELDNTAGRCKGATSITLDGEPVQGNVLPVQPGGRHQVKVII